MTISGKSLVTVTGISSLQVDARSITMASMLLGTIVDSGAELAALLRNRKLLGCGTR